MNALRIAFVCALALLLAAPPAAGDLLTPEEAKWVRECMERLGANAPRVRKSAEQALIGMGRVILPAVVANLKRVRGQAAESGLQRVLLALGRSPVLQDLTRMAQSARAGERKRIEALMDRLGDALGVGEPLTVRLREAVFLQSELVPHVAEHALSKGWPKALPGSATFAVQGDDLVVTPTGGSTVKVTPSEAAVVRVPVAGRRAPAPVLVYAKMGHWYAASASMRTGSVRKLTLELWDTDLDGRFDGPRDMARLVPAAWQFVSATQHLAHGDHTLALTLQAVDTGLQAQIAVQAQPDFLSPEHMDFLGRLHRWRAEHGLGPLRYDRKRSVACMEHANYLVLNNDRKDAVHGGASHHQNPSLPGATEAGAEAASSSVLLNGGMDAMLDRIAVTMLHRIAWVAPTGSAVGVGAARQGRAAWCGSWTERGTAESDARIVTVPAPGARGVRGQGGAEWPPPDAPTAWYGAPRGYPISVTHAHLGLRAPSLHLFREGATGEAPRPVAGRMWSPEKPIAKSHSGNRGSVFFMADRPMESDVRYWAVFEADGPEGRVRYAWSFQVR